MDLFGSENTKLLISALTKPQDEGEMQIFLEDLLTSQEIVEIARRMKVAQMLYEHTTYDEIARETGGYFAKCVIFYVKCYIYFVICMIADGTKN